MTPNQQLAAEINAALKPAVPGAAPVKPTPPAAGSSAATLAAFEVADQAYLDHICGLPAAALTPEQELDLGKALGAWCRENRHQ